MSKTNVEPVRQHVGGESALEGSMNGGAVSASPPAFQLQAGTIQRQETPPGEGDGSVQERFASHTLTAEDLTDEWVVEQFAGMSIEELFEYRRSCTEATVKSHILALIDGEERDPYQSYLGKKFTVNDDNAVIRDRAGTILRYAEGDEIPEGKSVGDAKVIPNGTEVYITDVRDDVVLVHAEDWGWTSIGNIQGGMFNETLTLDRADYDSQDPSHKTVSRVDAAIRTTPGVPSFPATSPQTTIPRNTRVTVLERVADDGGNVRVSYDGAEVWTRAANLASEANEDGTFTVTDRQAVIRTRSLEYPSTGSNLTQGDRMIILNQSADTDPVGQYVEVAYTRQNEANEYVRDESRPAVWTEAINFADNWADHKSDNARWRKSPNSRDRRNGEYLGQMDVVTLIGRDSDTGDQEVEKLSPELLAHYNTLRAAASAAGHDILLNSGFRSFPDQQELWDANPNPNKVARPGRSNHQNGIAIDINTGSFTSAMYRWMVANAPALGWIRTVDDEHWHWEQRPADAAAHGHKMPGVNP